MAAWIAVDEDGSEWIYSSKPIRIKDDNQEMYKSGKWYAGNGECGYETLPKGFIRKAFGIEMTWIDYPIELVIK